jgi:hypothetical protein
MTKAEEAEKKQGEKQPLKPGPNVRLMRSKVRLIMEIGH